MRIRTTALAGLVALSLAACGATYRNHGYVPIEEDLSAIVVGVDTRDTVEATVGKPSTSGVLGTDTWYYVSSRVKNVGWRPPQTIEREVLAISFAENGTVENIERYGLEDGRVVALSRRVTETSIRDFGLLQQLLRNFGRVNIGGALADDS